MGNGRSAARGGQEDQPELHGEASGLETRLNLYHKYRTAPVAWFPWLVDQIDWSPEAQVLEVGCGLGSLWVEAADRLPSGLWLTLTDLSPTMVTVAGGRVGGLAKYAGVLTTAADAEQLPFDDGSFDVAVANHVLYHSNPAQAVGELARVLRDDGVLVASTNGPGDHVVELAELGAKVFGVASASDALEVFSAVTGEPIARRSFEKVERRRYEDQLRCTDPDDVVAFITSTPPGMDATPVQLTKLRSAVLSRFDAGAGVYKLSNEVVVFLCRAPHRNGS